MRVVSQVILVALVLAYPLLILPFGVNFLFVKDGIIVPPFGIGSDFLYFLVASSFLMIAVLLYWLRVHLRAVYGMFEVLFAVVGLALTVKYLLATTDPSLPFDDIKLKMQIGSLQIFAAVYVAVRGLDNIGEGLPEKSFLKKVWYWLSLKRAEKNESRMS